MAERLTDIVFSEEEIQKRVAELGKEISAAYAGEPLVLICVLKGAFMFFSDLVRHVSVKPELDFVRIASYGNSDSPDKAISFTKDLEISVKDKHVLLIEDVVDTGGSMDFLQKQMQARGARSIRICAFIDKSERRRKVVNVDFAGFKLASGFIVGYGLDYAERYRELPDIRLLEL